MSRTLFTSAGLALCAAAMPAAAQVGDAAPVADAPPATVSGPPARRTYVAPYVEAAQILDADLNSGDVLTYSSIAVGVDAGIDTARASGQISYRYERRIGWDDEIGDDDVHSGLARGSVRLTRGLSVDAGALAARSRSDIGGAAPGNFVGNVDNVSQIYSVYAGPSLSTQAGPLAIIASYQAGYTKVETPTFDASGSTPRRLDYYDDSVGHVVAASVGTAPNTVLPVGVTASAAYVRETAGQLSQRFEGGYGRLDVLAPVSPTVAIAAGVGYEKIETSQKDALVDATGVPVLDRDGRFRTDPASPRRVAYRTDGVYYDAGVVWRPNRRTELRAAFGKRYGSESLTGTATWQASPNAGVAIGIYDTVTTFGRQLRTGLSNLPTSFRTQRDPFAQQFGGCVFGTAGATPGGCFDDVFQSISTASYRARGIEGVASATRGRSSYGAGAGYSNRRLHAPFNGSGIVTSGQEDESVYGQLFYGYSLTAVSGLDLNGFVNYYDSEVPGSDEVYSGGATATYYHGFGRLSATAATGLYAFKVGDFDTQWSAQALLGARYTF